MAHATYSLRGYSAIRCYNGQHGVSGHPVVVVRIWRALQLGLFGLALLAVVPVSANEPLRLALSRTPLSLPFYIAMHNQLFENEGVDLKIEILTGGYRTMRQLLQGNADLATVSEAVIMFNSFNGQRFAILSTFVTTHENVKVIARQDSDIFQAADLAGKRVGTVIGSASHYYLDTLSLLNGVDPKSIVLVRLKPESMQDALKNGQVDAVAIWQPFSYTALDSVTGSRELADDKFYNLSFNLIANPVIAETRRGELTAILRALQRAVAFIEKEPEKTKAILQHYFQTDSEYSDWILSHFRYRLELEQRLISQLESEARWAIYGGHVEAHKIPNFLNFIDDTPLRQVAPRACNIVK